LVGREASPIRLVKVDSVIVETDSTMVVAVEDNSALPAEAKSMEAVRKADSGVVEPDLSTVVAVEADSVSRISGVKDRKAQR